MKKDRKLPIKSVVTPITWVADYVISRQKRIKILKKNTVNLRTPYLMLCTHASVLDYLVASVVTFPRKVYNVCDKSDFMDHDFLANTRNCIYERKYSKNPEIIRNIKNLLKQNNIVALYPEIRYSFDGTNSAMSPSLYKIIRMLKVPVVVLNIHGSYSCESCWNKNSRKGTIQADMTEIITEEEIKSISLSEIKKRVDDSMKYDEYEWQKENNYKYLYKGKCMGLERILYKCPSCMEEFKIVSKKDNIYCASCGKQWKMNEDGEFEASLGKTEYKKVSDWCRFQKNKLRAEIMSCEYSMFSEVRVERLTKDNKYELVDEYGELWHTEDGLMVFFKQDSNDFVIDKPSEENYSYHIEYNYKNKGDCIKLIDNDETYIIYPVSDKFSVTKLALAVEIMYSLVREYKCINKKKKKKDKEEIQDNIQKDVQDNVREDIQKVITVDVTDILDEKEYVNDDEGVVIAVEFRNNEEYSEEKMKEIKEESVMVDVFDDKK